MNKIQTLPPFLQVREGLVPLVATIKMNGTPPDRSCLSGSFDKDTQAKLCHSISKDLGFDLEAGRLDVSVHPFSMGEWRISDQRHTR